MPKGRKRKVREENVRGVRPRDDRIGESNALSQASAYLIRAPMAGHHGSATGRHLSAGGGQPDDTSCSHGGDNNLSGLQSGPQQLPPPGNFAGNAGGTTYASQASTLVPVQNIHPAHAIQSVRSVPDNEAMKNRQELTLTVDGEEGETSSGNPNAIAADTNNPLYFGGIPDGAVHQGLTTTERFVGCIRDVMLRDDLVNFKEVVAVTGDVNTMSCPAA